MHELAIVQDLIKLCETNALKNGATKIDKVEISVGRLSGVESHYLKNAFDAFKVGTICAETTLIINIQDVMIKCEDCGFSGNLNDNNFVCPKCGKNNLKVTAGEDLLLMRLEME